MDIKIRAQNIEMSEALRHYVERRVGFTLRPFRRTLGGVVVRLSDLNGPRGGVDKRCRITAIQYPAGALLVQATDVDLYAAIDRAAHRLERTIGRRRRQALRSQKGQQSVRKTRMTLGHSPAAPRLLER